MAASLVLLLHIAFSLFAIFGGFGMLICLSAFWIHIPLMLWAAAVNLFGWTCPLTSMERKLWQAGGRESYEGGFVAHYFGPLLNLETSTRKLEVQTGLFVLGWNILVYLMVFQFVQAG